jgi:tetratricopeptide (TPR) repeat protein/tRNA A-37 threonylcarbamoyl transferase component Bud32
MNDTLPASPADRSPKSRVNTVFAGEFKLIRHLGRGDVADTYLAELLDPPALVALKIVRAELAGDRGQVEWLLREARAAAAVIDDHVAQVLDADISPEGEVYIVGEYVEGEDLGVLLRRTGRLPWARVRKLALQLVAGLRAAHEAGVLHRVIKPSNVLLQAEDRVKIVDFGLVRLENVTADREPGTVVLGDAVHFIAPEQALGEQVDARSDIYSLGVLLYTLLTGRVPFFGRPTQVAMQHKFATAAAPGSVAPEAGIPAVVEALILRAMSKRRESRFADMATLEQALREIGDDGQRRGGRGGVSTETVRAQPTTDSAMFYSLESLQTMLAATQDPRAQLGIYEKMGRALVTLSGGQNSAEAEAWRGWIAQGREYAYYQLAERHLAAEQWSELVEVYREHADATTDRNQKIGLLNAMGYVYDHSLADPRQAIAAYREMIALEPNAPDAVLALARLLERTSAWEEAAAALDHFLSLCNDPVQRGEELTRAGQLLHQRLHASERAEAYLHSALELQPGHAPALVLLADIYRGRKDYPRLAATLEALAVGGASYYERIESGAEAGLLYYRQTGELDKATVVFARVMELDPENVRVGTVLSKIYYESGNYSAAAPIFEMLVRKAVGAPITVRAHVELCLRAARVERLLGQGPRALKLFRRALELEPGNWGALLGQADLQFEAEAYAEAFVAYQNLLTLGAKEKTDKVASSINFRLAEIKRRQNQAAQAAPFLRRALEQDPSNWPALQATLEAQMAEGDYQGALNTRKAMINHAPSDDVKFDLFVESGRLFRERLGDPSKAVIAFQRALELRPREPAVLHRLLDLYTERRQWREAVAIVDQIVEVEIDPGRRARYHYTAAVLLRDELGAVEAALERFDRVLADDPTLLKAFQAIDTMMTQRKDWKALERAYRKMINRLPASGEAPLRMLLWTNLAEIYRSRLGDFKAAAKAFEVAAALDPQNLDRYTLLAELYEMLARGEPREFTDHLVRTHFTLLGLEPSRFASYHRLFEIYLARRELDKAFCVARTLVFLKQANQQETTLHGRYPQPEFRKIRQRLSEEVLRKSVFHADEEPVISAILGLAAPVLSAWRVKQLPYPLRPGDRVDLDETPSPVGQMLVYVAGVLGLGQPDLYFRPDEPGDLNVLNVQREGRVRPTVIALANALREKNENNLVFAVGRHALDLYPPHYGFMVIDRSPENLKDVIYACMQVSGSQPHESSPGVAACARELRQHLTPATIEQIGGLLRRLTQADSIDVKAWARAAELAGYRVGLIFCNDLATAAHAISQEQRMLGSFLSPKDALRELIVYSVSEEYFAARRALGLNVA